MIVCSKRVFLNVLTQLMDANSLINANYYIADQPTRNGIAMFNDGVSIDGEGTYHIDNSVTSVPTLNPYHVHYGDDTMSPLKLMSQLMYDVSGKSIEQMYREQLMNNDSLMRMYKFLYGNRSKGNGLRILIFVNDNSVSMIHVACEIISDLFGEDIVFLDKQYRNDIKGQIQYKGNQAKAMQVIQELNNYKMIADIKDITSNYQYGFGGMNNMEVYFNTFDVPQLFYIYEKLFPNEPLQPGNYTKDHIVHIITRKIAHACPQQVEMGNLMIPSFADMADLYNNISDDELMTIHE